MLNAKKICNVNVMAFNGTMKLLADEWFWLQLKCDFKEREVLRRPLSSWLMFPSAELNLDI